jgi:hypothetical protein
LLLKEFELRRALHVMVRPVMARLHLEYIAPWILRRRLACQQRGDPVGGDLSRKDDMVKAIEKAVFASVRSRFRYGNNHFPIQNFDLQDGVKAPTAPSG